MSFELISVEPPPKSQKGNVLFLGNDLDTEYDFEDTGLEVVWHNQAMSCSERERSCEVFKSKLCEQQFHVDKCKKENLAVIEMLTKTIHEKSTVEMHRAWEILLPWVMEEPITIHFLETAEIPLEFNSKIHAATGFVDLVKILLYLSTRHPLSDPFKGSERWDSRHRGLVTFAASFILL